MGRFAAFSPCAQLRLPHPCGGRVSSLYQDTDMLRVILGMHVLNHFVVYPLFRMLTLKVVKLLLPVGFYTVSLDQQDGYWRVPVAPSKRPYLGFPCMVLPPGYSPSW